MSALYPCTNRIRSHPDFQNIPNFDEIDFPVKLKDIKWFEFQNQI